MRDVSRRPPLLTQLRRAIINKTMQTVNIACGALSHRVRLDNLLAFKASLAPAFEARSGLKLTMTHLFFKAAASPWTGSSKIRPSCCFDQRCL